MTKETRLSVRLSHATRELLEKHVRQTGARKGHLVEQALLHHLQALAELPAEFIVRPRIVVSSKAGTALLSSAVSTKPTPALRELMRDGD